MSARVNPVVRYAHLTLARDRFMAAQRPVPPQVLREIQQLETWANTTFAPGQIDVALRDVERAKAALLRQEQQDEAAASSKAAQQAAALRQHNADTLARRISQKHGLEAQNAEEFLRLTKGLPLKRGTPKPAPVKPESLDAATKAATRHLDAKGEGFTAQQWKEKLDWLWEYNGTGQFREKARAIGLKPSSALQEAMVRFQEQEMVARLSGNRHEADPVREIKPDESDVRRATIVKKVAEALAKEGTDKELDEFARPPAYNRAKEIVEDRYGYEGDSVRKDIAETMLKLWPEDEVPEVEHEYTDTPEGDEED